MFRLFIVVCLILWLIGEEPDATSCEEMPAPDESSQILYDYLELSPEERAAADESSRILDEYLKEE